MRTFINKIIFFLLPILFCFIIMEFLLRIIPSDYSNKSRYMDNNVEQIETLIFGSSHSFYGVNPKYFDQNAYNLSFVSQTLDYDWLLLKKYRKKFESLKNIIIPISYFSLFSKLETSQESWRQKDYYRFFDLNNSTLAKNRFEVTSLNLRVNISRIYSFYVRGINPIRSDKLGMGHSPIKKNMNFKKDGFKAAKRHTSSNYLFLDYNSEIVNNICNLAINNNLQLIFVTPPTTSSYYNELNENQLLEKEKTMKVIQKNFPNTVYIDLMKDKRFNTDDFRDSDHLNENGAKKFSEILNSIIIKNIK